MIGQLSGKLVWKQPPWLLLEVGGIGYEVEAPMSTFYRLPSTGNDVTLETHLLVREDAQLIYGFATHAEKMLFRALIKVSGVGAKVALAVLSGISVDDFWAAVRNGESGRLIKLPGIGKRTAERIVIEMRNRDGAASTADLAVGVSFSPGVVTVPLEEARAALVGLGYRALEAQRLTHAIYKDGMSTDQIIREALKRAVR